MVSNWCPSLIKQAFLCFFDRTHVNSPVLTISYEPIPCTAVTSVIIDGPTIGQTNNDYTFNATISPANATVPYTYTWGATDQVNSSDTSATFNWGTTGQKTVSLTVENCEGDTSASGIHTVSIEEPVPGCEVALTELRLEGPTRGINGRGYAFNAVASPSNADAPITFTWNATNQSQQQTSGAAHTSEIIWIWANAGSKQISVTSENCGASFIRNLTIDIVPLSTLPDLTVGAPWYDAVDGTVGYVINNQGQNEAPSGLVTGLFANGSQHLTDGILNIPVPGGGIRASDFGTAWEDNVGPGCNGNDVLLTMQTDKTDLVEEGDESNNRYSTYWPCDLQAPGITGPTVTAQSAVTADISWTTDETTEGWLEYGKTSYAPLTIDSGNTGTNHSVNLTGLQPATTYRIRAFAEDAAGNLANSQWVYFETNTPGVDPPVFMSLEANYLEAHDYDTYTLNARLDDSSYIDRIEFYLDGNHVGTDYSHYNGIFGTYLSPPEMGYTPASFFNQTHTLEARAFTTTGLSTIDSVTWQPEARPIPIYLQFWEPDPGEAIEVDGDSAPDGTIIDAHVFAVETDWKCSWGGTEPNTTGLLPVSCSDVNPRPVDRLRLYLDGFPRETVTPVPDLSHHFDVDISNKPLGDHTLKVRAEGSDNSVTEFERIFELVRGTPDFSYVRTVTRQQNFFDITFTVTNEGTAAARVERLRDSLYGFQVIHRNNLPGRPDLSQVQPWYTVRTDTRYGSTIIDVDLSSSAGDYVHLPPGESFSVTYQAFPILYRYTTDVYQMGANEGDIFHFIAYREDFDNSGLWTDEFFALGNFVNDPELGTQTPLHQSVMQAVSKADYIIITSPYGLAVNANNTSWAGVDPVQERERLYSDLARLASLADGVIAYYTNNSGSPLNHLLEPGGYWYESLHPNFRQTLQGYVLIVGEQEVIPALGGGYDVPWSDLRYASTGGGDARPELVLGRLIGDNVATLRRPLNAAISYHQGASVYDHSSALLYAGRESGEGAFWDAIKSIDSRLPDSTAVTRIRSESIPTSQEESAFLNNALNQDIIVYRGHGYTNGEGFAISDDTGITTGKINGLGGFGTTRPFVMALACTAGNYEKDDDYGIAEATLREGASVFIASTTLSHRYRNNEAARWFFNRFNADRSIGDTFADLVRDKFHEWSFGDEVTNDTEWGRWAYQYQLYGDPKFGRVNTSSSAPSAADTILQGGDMLNITLGDLDVVDDGGWHFVSIPDGGHLQGEGQYIVPIQQVVAHYPAGTRVQDVQLTVRSGLVVTTGLNIPISYFRQDENGVQEQFYGAPMSNLTSPNAGWRPIVERPFTWRVAENNDGSSDLLLVIYPLYFDPATTNVRYYKEWIFNVETINSDVIIESFQIDNDQYGLGEPVTATVTLNNSGSAQNVIASVIVRDLRGVEVAGLPLQTLHNLQGAAAYDILWDSSSIPAGVYLFEISLRNEQGQELHKQRAEFTLGIVRAESVSLQTGGYPSDGSGVPLMLTVHNTGDTPIISGTLHLRVENKATGAVLATFSQDVPQFQPDGMVELNVVWDDSDIPEGDYQAVGYLRYGGTISQPLVRPLGFMLYLPVVLR